MVGGSHVKKALEERVYRHNLIEERLRDLTSEGTIMVDLEGSVVGQINGLVAVAGPQGVAALYNPGGASPDTVALLRELGATDEGEEAGRQ